MGKSKVRTFCPHCYRVVPAGMTCPCRNRDAHRKTAEPWRSSYRDREYLRNRQAVIDSQRGRCKDCGRVCAEWDGTRWITQRLGGEVDHEVPLCEGGTNSVENLALRCKTCHSEIENKRRKRRSRR